MSPVSPTVPDPFLDSAPPPEEAKKKKRPSRRRVVLLAALGVLVALVIAAALSANSIAGYYAKQAASELGLKLDFESLSLGSGEVTLKGVRISLRGVRSFASESKELRVTVSGMTPTEVHATDVRVALEGSAAAVLLDLTAWSSEHEDAFAIPFTAFPIDLTWAGERGGAAWTAFESGSLTSDGKKATLKAERAQVGGVAIGAIGATWASDGATLTVGLGTESLETATIRLDLHSAEVPATADITLRPKKLSELGAPLGLSLPAPGAIAEGRAHLVFGKTPLTDPIDADVTLSLTGWVPPHAKELDGIVFGDRTNLATKATIAADRKTVTLTETTVEAGAFKLKGGGSLSMVDAYALVTLDLSGQVACSLVARSAVNEKLGGGALAQMLGDLANQALSGSVKVGVHIEADTRNLPAARVTNDIGVGCGLRL